MKAHRLQTAGAGPLGWEDDGGDTLCAAPEIEHRPTPAEIAQTNGMVERFNGRIGKVL